MTDPREEIKRLADLATGNNRPHTLVERMDLRAALHAAIDAMANHIQVLERFVRIDEKIANLTNPDTSDCDPELLAEAQKTLDAKGTGRDEPESKGESQ